jgi:hypothetical protein
MSFYSIEGNPLIRTRLLENGGRIDRHTDTANIISDAIVMGILGWAPTGTDNQNLYNQNSGNVGIGTVDPQYKLDVVGTANVSSTLDCGSLNVNQGNVIIDLGNLTMTSGKINLCTTAGAQSAGSATLVAGTVTVNTTKASAANSYCVATHRTFAGTPGILRIVPANGSITITSTSNTDTSVVDWVIFN